MMLHRRLLPTAPFVGWTPEVFSYYLVTDKTGKVYFPIPGSPLLSYAYLADSELYVQLATSDSVSLGTEANGLRPIHLEYLTFDTPYVVKITTPLGVYHLTTLDTKETINSITHSDAVVKTHLCHESYKRLLQLDPAYIWTFNNRYLTNVDRYYIDRIGHLKLSISGAEQVYPSGWSNAAQQALYIAEDTPDASVELVFDSLSPYYCLGLHVATSGDCTLLTMGKLSLVVDTGTLTVALNGVAYPTTSVMTAEIVSPQVVAPTHSIYLIVNQTNVLVIVDNIVVEDIPIIVGTDLSLEPIVTLTLPSADCSRIYSGIVVIDSLVLPEDILCSPTVKDTSLLNHTIQRAGVNCTQYRAIADVTPPTSQGKDIYLSEELQRGSVVVDVYPKTDGELTYAINTVDANGLVTTRVPFTKDVPISFRVWLMADQYLRIVTVTGAASLRTVIIGESS